MKASAALPCAKTPATSQEEAQGRIALRLRVAARRALLDLERADGSAAGVSQVALLVGPDDSSRDPGGDAQLAAGRIRRRARLAHGLVLRIGLLTRIQRDLDGRHGIRAARDLGDVQAQPGKTRAFADAVLDPGDVPVVRGET